VEIFTQFSYELYCYANCEQLIPRIRAVHTCCKTARIASNFADLDLHIEMYKKRPTKSFGTDTSGTSEFKICKRNEKEIES
jgi:hypothetical protein